MPKWDMQLTDRLVSGIVKFGTISSRQLDDDFQCSYRGADLTWKLCVSWNCSGLAFQNG